MKFTEAISKCFRKYFVFKGRASRSEFWWFFLLWFLFAWPLLLTNSEADTGLQYRLLSLIYFMLTLAATTPFLAVMARRLHDVNRSAGWMVLLIIVAVSIRFMFAFGIVTLLPALAAIGFVSAVLGIMLISKGNKRQNRFGDLDNGPFTPVGIRTKISRKDLKQELAAVDAAEEGEKSNV